MEESTSLWNVLFQNVEESTSLWNVLFQGRVNKSLECIVSKRGRVNKSLECIVSKRGRVNKSLECIVSKRGRVNKSLECIVSKLYNILTTKPNRCTNFSIYFGIKLYVFRTIPLFIIRSFPLYTQQRYMSYSLRAGSGRNSVLILFARCQQIYMTYTVVMCTVKNSSWWTEELSKTCRALFQNKFEKLVHLVGFIIRIYHDARSPETQIHTILLGLCSGNVFTRSRSYLQRTVRRPTIISRHNGQMNK